MTDEFDDLDQQLDEAKPPERSVEICLRADLIEEYKRLKSEHVDRTGDSLAGGGTNQELEELEARIRKATKTFVLRSLPRKEYRKMVAKHRSKKPEDRAAGLDTDAFMDEVLRACTVSPPMTDERWEKLDASLSTGQWEKLHATAHLVNATEADLPF